MSLGGKRGKKSLRDYIFDDFVIEFPETYSDMIEYDEILNEIESITDRKQKNEQFKKIFEKYLELNDDDEQQKYYDEYKKEQNEEEEEEKKEISKINYKNVTRKKIKRTTKKSTKNGLKKRSKRKSKK